MLHNCGGELVCDLSNAVMICGVLDIKNKSSLVVVELYLQERELELKPENIEFYCTNCKERSKIEDIRLRCSFCGDVHNIIELQMFKTNSGVYCKTCTVNNDMKEEHLTPAINAFTDIRLR